MKWRIMFPVIALLALLPQCSPAQEVLVPEALGLGYQFSVGAAIFINKHLKDTIISQNRPLLTLAWYGPTEETMGAASAIGMSAEWTSMERLDGNTVNVIPIMLNYRAYGYAAGFRLWTNLGVGIIALSDNLPLFGLQSGGNFGWSAGFGVDITNEFYGQARFIGSKNPKQDGMIGIQLGYRF